MQNEESQDKIIVSEEELVIIRSTFKDNDVLLKAIRALLFGLDPTVEEKKLVRDTFSDKKLLKVFRNRLYPKLNKDVPIGEVADRLLGMEVSINAMSKDTIRQVIEYKQQVHKMMDIGLALLENPEGELVNLDYDFDIPDEVGSRLMARNQYIRHIEGQLSLLQVVANTKKETTQESLTRLKKNSSK